MSDAPQVAFAQPIPEHYTTPALQKETTTSYDYVDPTPRTRPRICGLTRRMFWIIIVVAVIVVAASVGGSVGGVLAVQKKQWASNCL